MSSSSGGNPNAVHNIRTAARYIVALMDYGKNIGTLSSPVEETKVPNCSKIRRLIRTTTYNKGIGLIDYLTDLNDIIGEPRVLSVAIDWKDVRSAEVFLRLFVLHMTGRYLGEVDKDPLVLHRGRHMVLSSRLKEALRGSRDFMRWLASIKVDVILCKGNGVVKDLRKRIRT